MDLIPPTQANCRAACTIVSPNYIAFAATLAKSYIAQHPDQRFFVLIVADLIDAKQFEMEVYTAVPLSQLCFRDLQSVAMRYDILELNTNVKPTFLKFLMERHSLDQVIYLDPDVFVYAPLHSALARLDGGATCVLTPHMTVPVFDGMTPSEQDILYNGTYNLGFIGLRRCAESARLLDWWEQRCLEVGYSEGRTGLFVDQKWMNLAPGLFEGVVVLRDASLNMAYWNLHERRLVEEEATDVIGPIVVEDLFGNRSALCFFHFSGIILDEFAQLSKNTDRFTLTERTDLRGLFSDYRQAVLGNRQEALEGVPYGFDTFSDGTGVNRLARRIYGATPDKWGSGDPFDADGKFARFAKRVGLVVAGKVVPVKTTWKDFKREDKRVRAVHVLLRLALRLLGPIRYELLMRYLGHISVLRHQSVLFEDEREDKG